MIFANEKEVKSLLRKVALVKKEIKLKIDFYNELISDFSTLGVEKTNRYKNEIDTLEHKLNTLTSDIDELFSYLDEPERLILTAKYLNSVRWDFIEYHVFYSRRHAIRIHNEAIKKLVGHEIHDIDI